jgi:hypothetical protein
MSNEKHGNIIETKKGNVFGMSPKGSCAIVESLLKLPSNYLN